MLVNLDRFPSRILIGPGAGNVNTRTLDMAETAYYSAEGDEYFTFAGMALSLQRCLDILIPFTVNIVGTSWNQYRK